MAMSLVICNFLFHCLQHFFVNIILRGRLSLIQSENFRQRERERERALERSKRQTNRKNSGNRAHVWHFLLDPQPWIIVESYIHCFANIFTFHCKVCDTLQNSNSVMAHLNRWTWMDLKLSNCCEVQQTVRRESETNTDENIRSHQAVQQRQI